MAKQSALENYKKIAWQIAAECAQKNGKDPVLIYKKMMERLEVDYLSNLESQFDSN